MTDIVLFVFMCHQWLLAACQQWRMLPCAHCCAGLSLLMLIAPVLMCCVGAASQLKHPQLINLFAL